MNDQPTADADVVTAVLDTLLPGNGAAWPNAGLLGITDRFIAEAGSEPGGPLANVLAALPRDFATSGFTRRTAALRAIDAGMLDPIVRAAYRTYYTTPEIADLMRLRSRGAI